MKFKNTIITKQEQKGYHLMTPSKMLVILNSVMKNTINIYLFPTAEHGPLRNLIKTPNNLHNILVTSLNDPTEFNFISFTKLPTFYVK